MPQTRKSDDGPLISLFLPRGFPSETVQVEYFLSGSFGGYGEFVRPQHDRQTVEFRAAVNGKPADRIQVIAYLPGCELVVFDFPLAGTATWLQLECKPLGTVTLHIRIPKAYVGRKVEVRVSYLAEWVRKFLGIVDGMETIFTISRIVPNDSGEFLVDVPDFYRQNLGAGDYVLDFRCSNCPDLYGPGVTDQTHREIPVDSSYPALIQFAANPPN